MKVILLAAGIGSRLRPLTDNIPKCMVPIRNKPLIDYWFELFEKGGVTEILVNSHYLHNIVSKHLKEYDGNLRIHESFEPILLGSLGTILANRKFYEDGNDFLIVYADNFSNINFSSMLKFHADNNSTFTMGLFRCTNPTECGIAEINKDFTITRFVEKPVLSKSNLANAGIYITNINIIDSISYPTEGTLDIGFHLLPQLLGKMKGYEIPELIIDIGTMQNYQLANHLESK